MMDLSKENISELIKDEEVRKYIMSAIILIISLVYFLFVLLPLIGDIRSVSAEKGDLSNNIKILQKRIIMANNNEKKVSELRERLNKHAKHFFHKREISTLLDDFATMAIESDVKILSITPKDLKEITVAGEKNVFSEMPIMITAKSGYHQLGNFITSLENSEQVNVIEKIDIKYDVKTPKLHDVDILVKTYVMVGDE